jgi:hypothetical protein
MPLTTVAKRKATEWINRQVVPMDGAVPGKGTSWSVSGILRGFRFAVRPLPARRSTAG